MQTIIFFSVTNFCFFKFLGKVFSIFKKWTKKMSKNENPKKLSQKKIKKNSKTKLLNYTKLVWDIIKI